CKDTEDLPLDIDEDDILEFVDREFCQDYEAANGSEKAPWNGRQIRNAFQIASSLAFFDARKKRDEQQRAYLKELHEYETQQLLQQEEEEVKPTPQPPALAPPKLSARHFKMIQTITDDFDEYMLETAGHTDGQIAFLRDDRADHWSPKQEKAQQL